MSIFDSIFDAIKEEASLVADIIKYQGPVAADAIAKEAGELKDKVVTQTPVLGEAIKREVSNLRQRAAEAAPEARQAFRDGMENMKREFTGEFAEETDAETCEEQDAEAQTETADTKAFTNESFGAQGANVQTGNTPADMLDDVSFIGQMKHFSNGPWQQYDILLAARGYGWDYMLDCAEYMLQADIANVSTITYTNLGTAETEVIASFNAAGSVKRIPDLGIERSTLAVGGNSRALGCPTKIVWFNQTQTLRIFTLGMDDEIQARKYAETLIRRSFGTKDAMKLGKPVNA